jgi:hypothetical protein
VRAKKIKLRDFFKEKRKMNEKRWRREEERKRARG